MRLHHLRITAFGPFAETVDVDFDELSAGGLFLLTGATGAGKTSVLDAVCFALYGQVPGDRAGAKHLRSDHAGPQLAPEVVLEVSIGARRFCFTRSPAWSRPKLRGTGETRVQAHVLVEEQRSGTWVTLTNRLDDAGLLVTDLLGMTATQFTQVALLPQGRFQAFLRATSAERHTVLQQLFRTDRFERVEKWLVERRTSTRRASEAAALAVGETVNRLREASGEEAAPADDLDRAAETGVLLEWADALTARAAHDLEVAGIAFTDAEEVAARTGAAASAAQRVHELQARGRAAEADLAVLAEQAGATQEARRRLDVHTRALPLAALAAAGEVATSAAEAAEHRWASQRSALAVHLGEDPDLLDRDALASLARRARHAHSLATAFAPRAAARTAALARLTDSRAQLQGVETTVAEIDVTLARQPSVIADAVAAVHEARAAAARLPVVRGAVERAQELLDAARRAELVGLELAAARTDLLAATEIAQTCKEQYLEVREARINGMAAELAGQLASGCSCPVCGSAEHPSPAATGSGGVGRAEEDAARRVSEDAAFELQARQVGLATMEAELAALEEKLAGTDPAALPSVLHEAAEEVERLEPLVTALEVLVAREEQCRETLRAAERDRGEALQERAALTAEIEQALSLTRTIDAEWEKLLAEPGGTSDDAEAEDIEVLLRWRAQRADALEAGLRSLEARRVADQAAASAATATLAAALEAGFTGPEHALASLLGADEATALEDHVRDAELRAHTARTTLADPDVAGALAVEVPDPQHLADLATAAATEAQAAASARDAARRRSVRLGELHVCLEGALAAWEPLQAQHRTVAALASLVEGKSVDNPLRMRLAAYVLAERLRQVVAAANERLARMTDQRYALEHTDDRGFGEQRGGLSLRVRDDWNGVQRDPATLSGGETFVVSLALALGLADTVAHEAGGTDIDTLFIDEGFGSLDADTLEDVMDTLDSLRDGGRVVGLVSHVPELRSRITTQLEVAKGRNGSTLRAVVSAG
ncbi:MAG: AAA family ATPase [Marmoricola sp.]